MVGSTAFWRERVFDRGTFFLRAAERRSVPVFFPAGFLLRAVVFLAILRSLSLGSHRAGTASCPTGIALFPCGCYGVVDHRGINLVYFRSMLPGECTQGDAAFGLASCGKDEEVQPCKPEEIRPPQGTTGER